MEAIRSAYIILLWKTLVEDITCKNPDLDGRIPLKLILQN